MLFKQVERGIARRQSLVGLSMIQVPLLKKSSASLQTTLAPAGATEGAATQDLFVAVSASRGKVPANVVAACNTALRASTQHPNTREAANAWSFMARTCTASNTNFPQALGETLRDPHGTSAWQRFTQTGDFHSAATLATHLHESTQAAKLKVTAGCVGRLVGLFDGNTYQGPSYTLSPDSSAYLGNLKNGRSSGQGIHLDPYGVEYRGEFLAGARHNKGTVRYPNGYTLEGTWNQGNLDGPGRLTLSTGAQFTGHFKTQSIAERGRPFVQMKHDEGGTTDFEFNSRSIDFYVDHSDDAVKAARIDELEGHIATLRSKMKRPAPQAAVNLIDL